MATVAAAFTPRNKKRANAALALTVLLGVTLLDIIGAQASSSRHARGRGQKRYYEDRSGFPKGLEAVKGMAKRPDGALSGMRDAAASAQSTLSTGQAPASRSV